MTLSYRSVERIVAATDPGGRSATAASETGTSTDAEPSAPAECVGPVTIARELTRALRSLTADDFLPLWICATALAGRLSPRSDALRVRVIRGAREAITPVRREAPDPATSFRGALRRGAEFRLAVVPESGVVQPVDATILVSEDGTRLYAESTTSAADAPLAQCWARAFLHLLNGMANRPDAPMASHPLLDEADKDRILHRLNPYRVPEVRHHTMTGPFEEQVERTPDADALMDGDGTVVSYRDLNVRANRLAQFLVSAGAGPGTRIGVCMDRGIEQIIAIYAAVKTGAAYVPIDAELPDSRLAYMLADSAPLHVLTDAAGRGRIPDGSWSVSDVGADSGAWSACATTNPAADATAGLLNVLYTSGTTGRPKGVAYPTDGALAHLAWMQSRYPFRAGDSALLKTSPGFDVSIWEIFWPLFHGARLIVCRPGGHRDPRHLARMVERHGISTVFLPPTVMAPFLENVSRDQAGALRWALCGGEPVTPRIRDTFYATLPAATLVNCYGPTEAGNVTDMVLEPDPGAPVPLGRPAANFRLTLLGENLELLPVGMAGEAYISAATGLAEAYWRAPGRTAERFVPDPYGPPGSRMYRTGDLCRYRDDGLLEHLGRIDRQVKIRGQRVEPGEIESVLTAHPDVADCVVIAQGDPVCLLAFVVPAGRVPLDEVDTVGLSGYAAGILPDHMRPERVVPVLRIPATLNGKMDKDALLHVWRATTDGERQIVPPADELEADLVELYRRVLGTEPVSVLDTFTQLGGHSLLAVQLLDACDAELHAQPDVTVLLTGTLREVAASLRGANNDSEARARAKETGCTQS